MHWLQRLPSADPSAPLPPVRDPVAWRVWPHTLIAVHAAPPPARPPRWPRVLPPLRQRIEYVRLFEAAQGPLPSLTKRQIRKAAERYAAAMRR